MATVDGGIANLIQGVSQQSRRDRRDGQCTLQENMSSDVVRNLSRRASTSLVGKLFNSPDTHTYIPFDTKVNGVHFLAIKEDTLRAFGPTGAEVTVNGGSDTYLGLNMVGTVIDGDMYLANQSVEVEMDPAVLAEETRGLVQIVGGQYGKTYAIKLKYPPDANVEIEVSWTTPDGSSASHSTQVATDHIAEQLRLATVGETNFTDHYTVVRKGDVLLFEWASTNHGRMEITADDGQGGTQVYVVTDRTDKIAYLPRYAPDGYTAMVTGGTDGNNDDTFFTFTQEVSGFGNEGVWQESVKRGIEYSFDNTTMPHLLTYNAVADEFTFAAVTWDTRDAGDDTTNPLPSFIGRTVQDLASFQGRMVILTDSTLVMSKNQNASDFWKGSATLTADDDPIDMGSTSKLANNLTYLIPHNRDLVVFSDNAQFIVFGRTSLTPSNASLVLSTEFQVNLDVRPQLSGKNITFLADYGNFSSVREFFTEGTSDANDSDPITKHVNRYIPNGMTTISSSSNYDTVIVHGRDTKAYLYQFLVDKQELLQSSWSTWLFKQTLVYSYFDKSTLYLITRCAANCVTLATLKFDNEVDTGLDYEVHLDLKQSATSGTEVYSIVHADADMVAVQGDGCPNPGLSARVVSVDEVAETVTLDKSYGGTVIFGIPYMSRYKPTMPMIKDQKNIKIGTGRLIIRRMYISYEDTGQFYTSVTNKYNTTKTDYMSGRVLGDPDNKVGEQPIVDGTFSVGVQDDADITELEIYTDHHTPCTLVDIEWNGQWNKRGRRR